MSGKTVQIFGLKERGLIKEGYFADLVSFSPDVDYQGREVKNLNWVMVNGCLQKEDGKLLAKKNCGKLLLN